MQYVRRFKLGKLYYKFIKGTPLENQGWTSEHVARLLESHGFIKRLTLQDRSSNGKFGKGMPYYIELEGKSLGRQDFFKLFKEYLSRAL